VRGDARENAVSDLLGDHDDRSVGVATYQPGHHRGVHHPQPVNAPNAQVAIDNRVRVAPHAACSNRVIDRLCFASHDLLQAGTRGDAFTRKDLGAAERRKRRGLDDCARDPHPLEQRVQILRRAQVMGVNAGRIIRPVGAQLQMAPAQRPQDAGMQGEAMTAQTIAAVIIKLRRHEVQLYVRTRIGGQMRAHERARLGDVADTRPGACEQIAQGDGQLLQSVEVVRDRTGALGESAEVEMILEIAAHFFEVGNDRDLQCMQVVSRPDAREHEKMRRGNGTGRDNDVALGVGNVSDTAAQVFDARCTPATEENPSCKAACAYLQIRTMSRGMQIGDSGAAATTIPLRHLVEARSLL
jgi:hypothetical protein